MASCELISANSSELISEDQYDVAEIVKELVNERKELVHDVFEAVRSGHHRGKEDSVKSTKTSVNKKMVALVDSFMAMDPRFKPSDRDSLVDAIIQIERNPPSMPSYFQDVVLERCEEDATLKNHEEISAILSYLDVDSLLALSLASKRTFYAVKMHMNKELYRLPFNQESIRTNLSCWKQVIDFFFNSAGTLRPIDRMNYQPLSRQINGVKSLFPVNEESMRAHTYVTFDSIKPHYIVYCDHEKPMSHTCSASNAMDCDNSATTKLITCSDFISEYMQRLEVKEDQLALGFNSEALSPKYMALLLKCYLDTISSCISKHEGQIEYRKTEFVSNAKHSIVHRIWIQLSLKWDFRFGPQPQNSLYLTIADHFMLDT